MKTILGHEEEIKLLKKLTEQETLGHAYIFYGPENIGKTTVAKGFANYLETGKFETADKPLQDSKVFSPEEGLIGIDRMRELKNFLSKKPIISSRKVAIIESGNLLNDQAQNALLKSAEEPPANSLIIVTLQNPESLIPTLMSRFQKIYFGEPAESKITKFFEAENKKDFQAALKVFGSKAGLIIKYLEDEKFRDEINEIKKYIGAVPVKKEEYIKQKLEDDSFNPSEFLKTVILLISKDAEKKQNSENWHKIMELFENLEYYNLNSKIQLKYLNQILTTWKNT
jgi:DNA polymerase III delta prime subunit